MAFYDLPLEQLLTYDPGEEEPKDFMSFWESTLEEKAREGGKILSMEERPDFHLQVFRVFDLAFSGYGGQPVRAWYILPKDARGPLPCVVEYIGYGGGRGYPYHWLTFASAGYAYLVMDTRGQGSSWIHGDTPDLPDEGANPSRPGFMTQGILSRETYYYRRLMTDAACAVEAAAHLEEVDPERIAVTGGSQGGGLALAAAGLSSHVALCLPDVPFLCHYRRAVTITDRDPYSEIRDFLKVHRHREEQVLTTLSYFDGIHFASHARARAYFSVALMDTICPPSTVFAAYNRYAGPKEIEVYTYNDHEGGQQHHLYRKLAFLRKYL